MNITLIKNPSSRSGKGRRLWPIWEDELHNRGIVFESVITEQTGDAFQAGKTATGARILVAVGGDGTINEVLDGIIQSNNPDLSLGVLYAGTSPDFCRFHGIPTEPHKAIQCLLSQKPKKVDVIRIHYMKRDGIQHTASFACGCNIGLGASVANFANHWRKRFGDTLGTGWGVVHSIVRTQPVDLLLEIDGVQKQIKQVNNLSILKNPHIASGLKLNVDLQPDDGKMLLVAIHGQTRKGLCALLPAFYSGEAADSTAVFMQSCSTISVHSPAQQAVEFDGDDRGFLPIIAQILPRALQLIGGSHDGI
ncbi:MAG: diacylglycerol kinase family protein [Kiritimatiellales bacterium]|nr:diacylglycerol kinase family protein [Kiritimatiellales bacterium]